mmetsp:Transcript_6026/g.13271  ORF Transcript_6026/g.13271 Transcript_6026/m.13271 type:complete len:463 (-) Transcript_6026:60-1448(-)
MPDAGKALVYVNTQEVAQMTSEHSWVKFPHMGRGMWDVTIKLVDPQGNPIGVNEETFFEVSGFPEPEDIFPLPPNAVGRFTNATPAPEGKDFASLSHKVQSYIYKVQHPGECGNRFLIWEPWGVVGFGAQILGLRCALALGIETKRVVVNNPAHEAHLVMSELKWRFGQSGTLGSPWGNGLLPVSPCTDRANVQDSVRPMAFDDLHGDPKDMLVSGDIFGRRQRDKLFFVPERLGKRMPSPPTLFWWWTEVTYYLMRPDPGLSKFVKEQQERMGWRRPIIGLHMRLGVDKNKEAQRFPAKYYLAEIRRVKKLFGIKTVFICSDRPKAADKFVKQHQGEFDFVRQPTGVEAPSPQWYVLTDILLMAESDVPIFAFSSNFGQTVLYLHSYYRQHRPTFISMDDHFEGARYYGWQFKLRRDVATGHVEIQAIDCEQEMCEEMEVTMHTGDKRVLGFDLVSPNEEL